jgi:hypothetical protein
MTTLQRSTISGYASKLATAFHRYLLSLKSQA